MNANFQIHDLRTLRFGRRLIDLHRNFHFRGFNYDLQQARVKLYWVKGGGNWIAAEELGAFTLLHENVTYFQVLLLAAATMDADIRTLSEVTFFPSAERDAHGQFIHQAAPGPYDDIIYSFVGGPVIRIGCAQVLLLK
ncbi:hypothetical protein [Flaviaesturariibacter aridisoli]|uniref:Uncharacterized protein n=1 Tax=Flaviaesturariibacter aridisoli TaxID=2545761 RepID=A0A4R4E0B4_9BACT|nr:hypothetical protein [Flaviaesturariibacter aridisoli]TCZ67479.1 hypothetical protein E0486_15480 [Flaviaesturariibacter aridisoli]